MGNLFKLLDKLEKGGRNLTDEEADLLLKLFRDLKESESFEKKGMLLDSISLACDLCKSCGRPW